MDNYEYLRNIRIPDGVFFAKGNPSRLSRSMNVGEDREPELEPGADQPGWISPSWPTSSSSDTFMDPAEMSPITSSSSSSCAAAFPQHHRGQHRGSLPNSTADPRLSLPRLSTVAPVHAVVPRPPQTRQTGTSGSPYSPLTTEDRKALNSFRVVL